MVTVLTGEQGNFLKLSTTRAFPASDSVEALALDPVRNRLVTSSHHGQVQVFCLEKNGERRPEIVS